MGRLSTMCSVVLAALLLAAAGGNDRAGQPPQAVAKADALSVEVLQRVRFDGTKSSDPEGAKLFFQWSFSDGSEPSRGPSPTHAFDMPGIYDVVLIVVDDAGRADTDILSIRVGLGGPASVPAPHFPYSR